MKEMVKAKTNKSAKGYVDAYLMVISKKNFPAYKKIAVQYAKIVVEYGALECREFIGDDLPADKYPALLKATKNEVIVTSMVSFVSKANRNKVNKKVMADERMKKMMNMMPLFDMKKMMYGGFKAFVEL
ncbi:MAG: DUF1428 family protein [Bacteroidetes bacterium]|nr:DUF1428 family protein [Bacteroidota bacterium]